MTARLGTQLGLLAVGIIVWGYGVRVDNAPVRLVGIALFAAAAAIGFLRRWRSRDDSNAR